MADGSIQPPVPSVSLEKAQSRVKRPPAQHPKFIDMVLEAISAQTDRKGATLQAIKSYIAATFPHVDANLMKSNVRKAIKKGLDNGVIVRPKASEDSKGVTGRFRIDKVKQASLNKPTKPKAPSKTEEKPKKKPAPKKAQVLLTKSPKKLKTPKKTSKSKVVRAEKTGRPVEKVPKSKPVAKDSKSKPVAKNSKSPAKVTGKTTGTKKDSAPKKPAAKKTPTKAATKPTKKKANT